jgi:hypothetical protein
MRFLDYVLRIKQPVVIFEAQHMCVVAEAGSFGTGHASQ